MKDNSCSLADPRARSLSSWVLRGCAVLLLAAASLPNGRAAGLRASDGDLADRFGAGVSVSGDMALVLPDNDYDEETGVGSTYLFKNVGAATGTITESIKLIIADTSDSTGAGTLKSVSLSGDRALVGAPVYANASGRVYFYTNLASRSGTISESAILRPEVEFYADTKFGAALSLSGTTAIVGAPEHGVNDNNPQPGNVYVFHGLTAGAGGVRTENAVLRRSDPLPGDGFGFYLSLSGGIAVVGDPSGDNSGQYKPGNAYLFRNVDTASGIRSEDAQLFTTDGTNGDSFGAAVHITGTMAVIGAPNAQNNRGFAYIYRDLGNAEITSYTESAKLVASDTEAEGDTFGEAVAISGDNAIVGASGDEFARGAAYLFRNVSTATGILTENVKVLATEGVDLDDRFGCAVSIDGDLFVVGAKYRDGPPKFEGDEDLEPSVGKAYSGSVSSMSVLDAGDTTRNISGLSFISRDNWIIGQTTDRNEIVLFAGDSANVTAAGKAAYIGQQGGSDENSLIVKGSLAANEVYIGAVSANTGNTLRLDSTATFAAAAFRLAPENTLSLQGDYVDIDDLLVRLGSTPLQVWRDAAWVTVDAENHASYIALTHSSGYTLVRDINSAPPPNTTPGSNVVVQSSGGDARVTFGQVTGAGNTTFTPINPPSSAGAPPSGFTILENEPAYEITTTAAYTPPITACFTVSSINTEAQFARVRVLHGENGQLVDRTILPPDSPAPDFATRTVCGRVDSLSPFVLALAPAAEPSPSPTATPGPTATATPNPTATATPAPSASATPSPTAAPAPRQLLNIATRLRVQTGENVLIGGVIVTGTEAKKVIIRAIGPSLADTFEGALTDTTLELYAGDTLLAANDNWRDTQQPEIEATTIPPNHELESAIVYTLPPGSYTAVLSGKDAATGIGVVEVYDIDQAADSKLANIASRGFVELGENVMIGGLIVGGSGTEDARILVRAIGPSLAEAGVSGALGDPTLELRDANGELVRENDDWNSDQQVEIETIGLQPMHEAESTLIERLPAGNYTAIVRGKGETSGVGLVEVYHVP